MTFALEKKLAPLQRQYFAWTQSHLKKKRKHNRVPLVGPQKFEVISIIIFYFWLYGGVNLNCAQQSV